MNLGLEGVHLLERPTATRGGYRFYLEVEKLFLDDGLLAENVRVPLSEEKYRALKQQYDDSTAEVPMLDLRGLLELKVRAASMN